MTRQDSTILARNVHNRIIWEGEPVYVIRRPRIWWRPWTWFGCRWLMFGFHDTEDRKP